MKTKIIFAIATIITFAGCRKEVNRIPRPTVNDIFRELGDPVQVFTIDAGSYQTITGVKGIKVLISPGSFVYPNKQTVTGSVKIELREMLTKRDMILNNAPSTSGGKPLVSGGEFYIRATQGSTELKLAPNRSLDVRVPITGKNTIPMKRFYAKNIGEGEEDWVAAPDTSTIPMRWDTLSWGGANFYNEFKFDSMGWGNCDMFYSHTGPKTPVKITVDATYDNTNTTAWIAFRNTNTSSTMTGYNNHTFFPDHSNEVPVGLEVNFVVVSKMKDQFYLGVKPATITVNHNETVIMKQMTKQEIQAELNKL